MSTPGFFRMKRFIRHIELDQSKNMFSKLVPKNKDVKCLPKIYNSKSIYNGNQIYNRPKWCRGVKQNINSHEITNCNSNRTNYFVALFLRGMKQFSNISNN